MCAVVSSPRRIRRANVHSARVTSPTQDALRRNARAELAAGPERAGARAHFRAMGIDPARLDGPIIGIASTWTQTMPCNLNQRELARRVGDAVTAAGGVALEFNTIAVSDNQSQGTPGMRASLVSREVIADSIELMVHAHDFDGLVCLVGCDKTTPAALMALARVDKPAVVLYSGPMRAGRHTEPPSRSATSGRLSGPRNAGSSHGPSWTSSSTSPAPDSARAPATSRPTRWRSRSTASGSRVSVTG